MPSAVDVLKKKRGMQSSSPDVIEEDGEEMDQAQESTDTPRTIKLTDEETKELEQYEMAPGEEVVLEMTGMIDPKTKEFAISSVKYAQAPEETANAGDMNKPALPQPPIVRTSPAPYPS